VQILWPPLENEEEFANVKSKFITRLGLFMLEALSRFHFKRTSTIVSLSKTNKIGYRELRWCQCACMA
jgi:hypothetical protein